MTEGAGYSLSDVAALMQNKSDGFLEGNGIIILILFFLIFGFGGGMWGNRAQAQGATTADLYSSLGTQDLVNDVRSGFQNVNDGICGLGQSIITNSNANAMAMNNGFNSVNSAITNLGYQNQQCCCELKTAIHSEGEATRALIEANLVQNLRDRLADKDRELTAAQLTIQNTTQTSAILDSLGRYVTNPPVYGCSGCSGF